MKKMLFTIPLAAFLTACGAPSVEDLVDDPKLLKEVGERCAEMKRSEVKEDASCQNLQKAAEALMKEQMDAIKGASKDMMKSILK